jgi:hypothetical protein
MSHCLTVYREGKSLETTQTHHEIRERLRRALSVNEVFLKAALERARASHDHAGTKGALVEEAVRSFLRGHLPRRLDIGHGEVIDRFGSRSPQMDAVILTEDQPFVHGPDTPGMYLVEGVSAAAELKSALGQKELQDALEKGQKFRKLRATYSRGDTRQPPSPSDAKRFYASAPYFCLALETKIAPTKILEILQSTPDVPSPEPDGPRLPALDALFTLDKGVYINFGDGEGSFAFAKPDGSFYSGWVYLGDQEPLVHLFTWLHAVMPRVNRFSSIATPYLSFLSGGPEDLKSLFAERL